VVDDLIAKRLKKPLRYWDGVTHQNSFALPRFIREAVAAETRVVTHAEPLIVTYPVPASRGLGFMVLIVVAGLVVGSPLGELAASLVSTGLIHDLLTRGPQIGLT